MKRIARFSGALAAWTLLEREVVRFLRQRNRLIGALATPLIFWLMLGHGMGSSFRAEGRGGGDYLEYFFPGMILLVVLFTSIFSTISIIEDRREGFMQGVLASPAPEWAIVLGKVMGGTVLSVLQAALLLCLAPLIGIGIDLLGVVLMLGAVAAVALGLTAMGHALAWRSESVQGYHAIMNVFLMPLWLLSGALFPVDGAAGWVKWVMVLNPVHYGHALLVHALYPGAAHVRVANESLSAGVVGAFAVAMLGLAILATRDRRPLEG
ncbi:MAG TPA: ABC transporter permease [Verrucomicrobiae bacterium]|nr:ABC transporter permease [Verrucomicrobiae bacterium]